MTPKSKQIVELAIIAQYDPQEYLSNGAVEAVYPKRRNRSKLDGYAEKLAAEAGIGPGAQGAA